jgi:radical SAM superfamily enzyme YgiQ (UPF0313 family)
MKLGLLALSGVRCRNEELLKLGLTLPGFVERSKVIASLPSLGLLTLAGMTPADITVEYLEIPDPGDLTDLPGDFDVVAISSFTAQIKEAYRLADRYRAAGVKVMLGGLHVTLCPDEAAQHADAILIGEAEPLWPQVVADLRSRRLRARYDARGMAYDFSASPMPRFELLEPENYNRLTVQTQRGCPYHCEFCAASIRLNPRFRVKPVDRVLAEIRRIKEIWPRPFIEFADDNTFADKAHSRKLVRALIPEGLRWFTESDISIAGDPELLELLRESGCEQILIGLESPNSAGLDGLERKGNWKLRQLDGYKRAIATIQDAGVTVNGCFVLGLDGADETSFDAVFDFVRESGLYEVQITLLTPFPGTPLYHRLEGEGRILHPGAWELCTLFDVNFRPQNMTASELEEGFRKLLGRLYEDKLVSERRRGFFRRLRAGKRRQETAVVG